MIRYWSRQWNPTPVLLPGKSHGWRNLVGCSPWGRWESDTTERLHFHFSLSCIAEGNGNHSSVLAWRIPGTEEPSGLSSMGSRRDGHDWSDFAAAACRHIFYFLLLLHNLRLSLLFHRMMIISAFDIVGANEGSLLLLFLYVKDLRCFLNPQIYIPVYPQVVFS